MDHLLNGMIGFCSWPVHAADLDQCRFRKAGYTTPPAESRMRTELDATDSIVLSTLDACYTIQLLCDTLSPQHFPLQLPAYDPLLLLDQGYR